jgi:hypothetical protein
MKLSTAEIESLNVYVEAYGRTWKATLRHDWQIGKCSPFGAEHAVIQGLRNRSDFGPAGLEKLQQIDLEPTPETIPAFTGQPLKVQPAIWETCIEEAKADKRWAVKTNKSPTWHKQASDMSRQMLVERLTLTIRELAENAYRYWHYRAHLQQGKGFARMVIDPAARERWIEAGGTLEKEVEIR